MENLCSHPDPSSPWTWPTSSNQIPFLLAGWQSLQFRREGDYFSAGTLQEAKMTPPGRGS